MQSPSSYPVYIPQAPAAPQATDPSVTQAAQQEAAIENDALTRGSTLMAGASQPDPTKRGSSLLGNIAALG